MRVRDIRRVPLAGDKPETVHGNGDREIPNARVRRDFARAAYCRGLSRDAISCEGGVRAIGGRSALELETSRRRRVEMEITFIEISIPGEIVHALAMSDGVALNALASKIRGLAPEPISCSGNKGGREGFRLG